MLNQPSESRNLKVVDYRCSLLNSVEGFGYCLLSRVISEKRIKNCHYDKQLCKVNGGVFDQTLTVGFGLFLVLCTS